MPLPNSNVIGGSEYAKLKATLTKLNACRDHARATLAAEKQAEAATQTQIEDLATATGIAQAVAAAVQQQAHQQIARVVSRSLAAIFDDPYEFTITFEQKRGRTEAALGLTRDGLAVDPRDGVGGGVVDVAAFALRVAALVLSRPARRRLLVLDEPFKFLSAEYRGRVRGMLEILAAELDIQFIIVTHFDDLETGAVIEIGSHLEAKGHHHEEK